MGRKRGVHYKDGSFYRVDDRSGFVRRAEDTQPEWTGLIVGTDLWEARQPQDFVKGVPDVQSVPNARPESPNVFVGPVSTTLSLPGIVGATFLYLDAINSFNPNGQVGVMMDSGEYFMTTQVGGPTPDGIAIANPLPGYAAKGNVVTAFLASPGVFP